jgi:hypothetical protein
VTFFSAVIIGSDAKMRKKEEILSNEGLAVSLFQATCYWLRRD